MNPNFKIEREILEDGQEMFDVYISVEGVDGKQHWEILDSFQQKENAEKYIAEQRKHS